MFYTIVVAFFFSFFISIFISPIIIKFLIKFNIDQKIRKEGPQSHQQKNGTPTMGGIIFLLPLFIITPIFIYDSLEMWTVWIVTLLYAIIGLIDDFIKVKYKRNLGLKIKEKLLGQIFISLFVIFIFNFVLNRGTDIWVIFLNKFINLHCMYYLLVFFVLVGTTNAVNLTDGLDGLVAGTIIFSLIAFTIISMRWHHPGISIICMILAGSCLGFLKFNKYKAQVFMGDTGSLALGAFLSIIALIMKVELLLIIIGGIYVIETLSVIIQIGYYKYSNGKRFFKMSPIHHHFELLGWSEKKIMYIFLCAGFLFSLLGLGTIFL